MKIDKAYKKFCESCGKQLIIKCNRDIERKRFCSKICNGTHQGKVLFENKDFVKKFIEKGNTVQSNLKKGHKGKNHHNWKGGKVKRNCIICNKEFEINQYKIGKINCGKYCSKRCNMLDKKANYITISCLNCEKKFEDRERKNRKFCSKSCRMIYNRPNQKNKNTSIELKIKSFLENQNIKFEFQPYIKGIVNADFLVSPNIVVFADGDYWHNLEKAIARDKIVNKKLQESNYKILRFSEKDIKNNFDIVKNKIMEVSNA